MVGMILSLVRIQKKTGKGKNGELAEEFTYTNRSFILP